MKKKNSVKLFWLSSYYPIKIWVTCNIWFFKI